VQLVRFLEIAPDPASQHQQRHGDQNGPHLTRLGEGVVQLDIVGAGNTKGATDALVRDGPNDDFSTGEFHDE